MSKIYVSSNKDNMIHKIKILLVGLVSCKDPIFHLKIFWINLVIDIGVFFFTWESNRMIRKYAYLLKSRSLTRLITFSDGIFRDIYENFYSILFDDSQSKQLTRMLLETILFLSPSLSCSDSHITKSLNISQKIVWHL